MYLNLLRSFLTVTWFSSMTVAFVLFYFQSYDYFPFWYNCCKFQRAAIKRYAKCCRTCIYLTVSYSHVTLFTSAPFCMSLQQHSSQRARKILRLDAKELAHRSALYWAPTLIVVGSCYSTTVHNFTVRGKISGVQSLLLITQSAPPPPPPPPRQPPPPHPLLTLLNFSLIFLLSSHALLGVLQFLIVVNMVYINNILLSI